MIKKLTNFFITALLTYCYSINAQQTSDFETWNALGIQKKLFDNNLTLSLSEELRLKDNSTKMDQFFTEFGIKYKFLEHWTIGAGYRIIRENEGDNEPNSKKNRWNTDLGFKHKIDRFTLGYRLRYQSKSESAISKDDGDIPIQKLRTRLKVNYNIKNWKWDPYVAAELFWTKQTINVDNYIPSIDEEDIEIAGMQKIRLTVGTSKKIKKIGQLNLFYRFEHEFNKYPYSYIEMSDWSTQSHGPIDMKNWHIIGINFNFKL